MPQARPTPPFDITADMTRDPDMNELVRQRGRDEASWENTHAHKYGPATVVPSHNDGANDSSDGSNHYAGGYSGIDRAMSAHADKLHPVRRR